MMARRPVFSPCLARARELTVRQPFEDCRHTDAIRRITLFGLGSLGGKSWFAAGPLHSQSNTLCLSLPRNAASFIGGRQFP